MKAIKISSPEGNIPSSVANMGDSNSITVLTIVLHNNETRVDEVDVSLSGFNGHTHVEWVKMKNVAQLSLQVEILHDVASNMVSTPINTRNEQEANFVDQQKLAYFFKLKMELQEKGLLV